MRAIKYYFSIRDCCCCAFRNYTLGEHASVSWNCVRCTDTTYLESIQRQSVSTGVQKIVHPFWKPLVSVFQFIMLETAPCFVLHTKTVLLVGT
jgi:hypothetical protein